MKIRAMLLIASLALHTISAISLNAQIVFQDDFGDGNFQDGSPVSWVTRTLPGAYYDATSGDLVLRAGSEFVTGDDSLAADPVEYVMEDTSVVSQVRSEGPFENLGIGARWNEAQSTGYFAGIDTSGILFVGKCDGLTGCPILGTYDTGSLRIDSQDVLLRFDAIGDTLSAWAWAPETWMPEEPQILRVDTGYDRGTPAIFANPLPNGGGTYRFIRVSVPEPSTSFLVVSGLILLSPLRRRY